MQAVRPPYSHRITSILTAFICLLTTYGTVIHATVAQTAPLESHPNDVASPAAPRALSGLAFRDVNFNGTHEVGETGVGGVTVTTYDVGGASAGATTTAADGTYSLLPAGAGPFRIEFSSWPSFLLPGPRGADSGTTVQFATTANATNVSLGLVNPADFAGTTQRLATTLYSAGDASTSGFAALVSWPYTADTDTYTGLVTHTVATQIGSTYGLAYRRSNKDFFTSAFVKRGVGLGTGGLGAIYKVPFSGTASILVDLGAAAGVFTRTRDFNPNPPSFDEDALALVGKAGFGDLDMSEDETTLWTINLADRSLYKIDIALAEAGPGAAGATRIGPPPNPGCVNDSSGGRPFGLTIKDGVIYVGGVCTGQDGPALGSFDNIEAYVYTYTESAGWGAAPVLRFHLNYPTTCADVYSGYTPNKLCRPGVLGSDASWYSWFDRLPTRTISFTTDYSFNSETTDGFVVSPQPELTGIEFSGNDMIIALRDRFADQFGWDDPGPFGASPFGAFNMSSVPMGDILRASPNGPTVNTPSAVISWTIEKNTTGSTFGPTAGADTGAGPCLDPLITTTHCGEFFIDNFNPLPSTGHDETTMGSVAQVPGFPEVAVTVYDPFSLETAGVLQLSNITGARVRGYEIVKGGALIQAGGPVNKANGLGDLEALIDPAPLEIGNLVWRDSNSNGVQDPSEAGIASVTVRLYRPGVGPDCVAGNADDGNAIATAVTSAIGQYYFKTSSGPDATPADETGLVDGSLCVLQPTATYSIRLDNAADYAAAGPLNSLFLTERDDAVASPSGSDSSDSDSSYVGTVAVITHTVPISGIGSSNHTLDFGFTVQVTTGVSLGNQVWFDTNNNRLIDPTETGVAGAALQLFFDANANGAIDLGEQTPIATQATTAQGFYLFTQTLTGTTLVAGNYAVCVASSNFITGGVLLGYTSSGTTINAGVVTETVPANPDGDTDNDDNGLAVTAGLCANGALSGLLSVTGNEPMTEVPDNSTGTVPGTTPGLIDPATNSSSNLTLDFGFTLLLTTPVTTGVSLGNQVWFDTNNNRLIDPTETGAAGAALQLFFDANANNTIDPSEQTPIATQTTTAQGFYLFTQTVTGTTLAAGNYAVCVASSNFITGGVLLGYTSSGTTVNAGVVTETVPANPDGDVDNDDNGLAATAGLCANGALSGLMSVTGNEPITEVPANSLGTAPGTTPGLTDPATNPSSNLTLDFGFISQPAAAVSIGNQVWFDTNNNGSIDSNEVGIPSVTLRLYFDANSSGVLEPGNPIEGTPIATQTTTAQGFYLFTSTVSGVPLAPGNYNVCVAAENRASGGVLNGYYGSGTILINTGALTESMPADPNVDIDNNDHGYGQVGAIQVGATQVGAICMPSLISVTGNEPTTEVPGNLPGTLPGTTPGRTDVVSNTASNLTVDFGFYQVGLGDIVWVDGNNSGKADGAEKGIDSVPVKLYPETGTTEIPVGPDGCWGTMDDVAGGTRTRDLDGQGIGHYRFCGLPQGSYRVCIVPPVGYGSSTGGAANPFEPAPDPDGEGGIAPNTDGDDNGTSIANGICTNGIESKPVTLVPGSVPNVSNAVNLATGKTFNPTVDFGLIVLGPNAVSLTSFDAARDGNGVRISWHTGVELNTFGFAIYRAEGADRTQATLVTHELVAALGADSSYQVLDVGADASRPYHYWLKEFEQDSTGSTSGTRENWYGPAEYAPTVSAVPAAGVAAVASDLGGGVPVAAVASTLATPASMNSSAPTTLQSIQSSVTKQIMKVEALTSNVPGVPVAQATDMPVLASQAQLVSTVAAASSNAEASVATAATSTHTVAKAGAPQMVDVPPPERAQKRAAEVVQAGVRVSTISKANLAKPNPVVASPTGTREMGVVGRVLLIGLVLLLSLTMAMGVVVLRRRR